VYPIIEVPDDAYDLPEQLGTKRKFWYRDNSGKAFLFKEGRPNTGENWAEKVCSELCELLAIPHARYELAAWRAHKGVITPKFLSNDARLVLGNEILAKVIEDYPHTQRYQARQHTVNVAMAIMRWREIGMPLDYVIPTQFTISSEVFLGYLMLDALVSNQDRHHENWGVIVSPGPMFSLAPSFDHASSLGRNELDTVRLRRLKTKDKGDNVEAYVRRATSAFYPTLKGETPLSCLAAFEEGAKLAPKAVGYWLERLENTTSSDYEQIFGSIPDSEITEPASQFALEMLEVNRRRLLNTRIGRSL
jgi:hypothetical protein